MTIIEINKDGVKIAIETKTENLEQLIKDLYKFIENKGTLNLTAEQIRLLEIIKKD